MYYIIYTSSTCWLVLAAWYSQLESVYTFQTKALLLSYTWSLCPMLAASVPVKSILCSCKHRCVRSDVHVTHPACTIVASVWSSDTCSIKPYAELLVHVSATQTEYMLRHLRGPAWLDIHELVYVRELVDIWVNMYDVIYECLSAVCRQRWLRAVIAMTQAESFPSLWRTLAPSELLEPHIL